jgi:hypothetical protein
MWQEPGGGNPGIMALGFRSPGKHDTGRDRSSSFVASATGGSGVIKLGPTSPAIATVPALWPGAFRLTRAIVHDTLARSAAWAEDALGSVCESP